MNNSGLFSSYVVSPIFVPFAIEKVVLVYLEKQMGVTMGSIQNRLRLKNLSEYYLLILMAVFSIIAIVSFSLSPKYFNMLKTEKEVEGNIVVEEEKDPINPEAELSAYFDDFDRDREEARWDDGDNVQTRDPAISIMDALRDN